MDLTLFIAKAVDFLTLNVRPFTSGDADRLTFNRNIEA
jgi:hypothetical protein